MDFDASGLMCVIIQGRGQLPGPPVATGPAASWALESRRRPTLMDFATDGQKVTDFDGLGHAFRGSNPKTPKNRLAARPGRGRQAGLGLEARDQLPGDRTKCRRAIALSLIATSRCRN